MGSMCIECSSTDTELFRGDDGHFRKECFDCGYVGGPYVSEKKLEEEKDSLFNY